MSRFDNEYWDTLERRRTDPDYEPPARPKAKPQSEETSWPHAIVLVLAMLAVLIILAWLANLH